MTMVREKIQHFYGVVPKTNKQKTYKEIGLEKKKLKIKGVLSFLKAESKMKILYLPIYTESVKLAAKEM